MKGVAVFGGGALGMLLAGKLALAEVPVTVWTRTEGQAAKIREAGISIEQPGRDPAQAVRLDAAAFGDVHPGYEGIVLVALKQTSLNEPLLAEMRRKLGEGAGIVLFQNGIGHVERAASFLPGRELLAAVTTEGALRIGETAVRHTGSGETWIGRWEPEADTPADSGKPSLPEAAANALEKAGFSVFVSNQIRERMLRKLLVNAVINPLTALWRVTNGELPATPERLSAMRALFRETEGILRLHGLRNADDDELWETVLGVCTATAANRSSMLQDVDAGRETEIDAMNGAVSRMGEASGMEAPWNAAVTALVKAILSPKERGV
ncbi:ketopantoate reductase family protein [Cohnella candidum]|nr:2-dehydropantoate 2-reductase [Cohnella candidum]